MSPNSSSTVRRCSFSSFMNPVSRPYEESIDHNGLRSAFLGYEMPTTFHIPGSAPQHESSPSTENFTYSPPPSPTLNRFISRFDSPSVTCANTDTPTLLDESLPTTISSPFLMHTPMPYTTTRNPRSETTLVGLGITGLFMRNGTVFDGMGVLPRRDECSELGFFMDEADNANFSGEKEYPECKEDAWRKSILSPCMTGGVFEYFGQVSPASTSIFRWSPPAASSPFKPAACRKELMLEEPENDDVFFTRSPPLHSPFFESSNNVAQMEEISRNVVSGWFRTVQSPDHGGLEERLASVL